MIRHVAIVELKNSCTDEERDALVAQIAALADEIPGVLSMTAGVARDLAGAPLRKICLVSDHASRSELAAYLEHPAHRAVAVRVGELREVVSGADFEI